MKINLEQAQIKDKILVEFYDHISTLMGIDSRNTMYDCRKIWISKEIQQMLYESYRARFVQHYEENPRAFDAEVTMTMALGGPKVNENLQGYQVVVLDGFFQTKTS